MHLVFRNFVEGVRETRDLDGLRTIVADAIAAFDLSRFAYFAPLCRDREALFFSTYPTSWTDHYFQQGYEAIDPVFTLAQERMEPLRWGKDVAGLNVSGKQAQLFEEAAAFGIRNGLTIPLCDSGGSFAALTFAADSADRAFQHSVGRNLATLQLMSIVLSSAIRRKFVSARIIDGVKLTLREIECLRWAALGKSAWEISRILGIARRTVSFHLENAKAKLGVRSVCQAVARFAAGDR
ncbi:MAG: LuxR family transcriptional regulator [Micropepsaceae bacterium]